MEDKVEILNEMRNPRKDAIGMDIRSYYPKFNAYRSFMHELSDGAFWKQQDVVSRFNELFGKRDNGNAQEIEDMVKKYGFLLLQRHFQIIRKLYHKYANHPSTEIVSREYVEAHRVAANAIWYYYDRCRESVCSEINNDKFESIEGYSQKEIKRCISILCADRLSDKLNFGLIAEISGIVETDVINPILELTERYESIE